MYDWFKSFAVAMKGESREISSALLRGRDLGKGVQESTKRDVERGRVSPHVTSPQTSESSDSPFVG